MSEAKTNLTVDFNQPADFARLEEQVLDHWDKVDAFKKSVEQRPETKPFVFYDGPPFATGLPHYGHILASTIKDVIPRYYTMKGYRVERQWGWDCHGLPIENIIEKELNLADKKAIENYGIDKFNQACRTTVVRYVNEWRQVIRRLGRWVDMENDYKTMEPWYMESLWWVFKQLWQRGLIYKGYKSMHICPRCSTPLSNFEVTQGYKEVKDISVYAQFKLKDPGRFNVPGPVFILAWTTTPWTLPGNVALAFHPEYEYMLFQVEGRQGYFLAAKDRLADIAGEEKATVLSSYKGSDLGNLPYEPLFPYYQDTPHAFHTVVDTYVTLEEGTGIVHIAPAFGEDDYRIGQQEGIPLVQHITMDGTFKPEVTDFAHLPAKPKADPLVTDIKILKFLQAQGSVFKKVNVKHTYPHCWRCDTPLLNYATDSWFVKVTQFKPELLANNQKINWIPGHIKNGRFGKWLEGARDWAISRNRFWGTPLPIWQSDDGDIICVGSLQELQELSGQNVDDLHKPGIDEVTITKDGKTYRRIPEVLDCWFESGAMPYASFHYPMANKQKFEASFPAEFISEGQDQTRGWFYTLHVLATALTLGPDPAIPVKATTSSFKNCVVTGIVLAEDGKKMSKRLNNYPDPMVVGQKYGIDSLRLYLMSSPVVRADNLNFSEKDVDEIKRRVVNIFWNTFKFYRLYDNGQSTYGFPAQAVDVMDRWLVSVTEGLTAQVTQALDAYDVVTAVRKLMDYVDQLSTWYLRRSRDRLRDQNPETLQVFRTALRRWTQLAAPFAPFITELVYQNLPGDKLESVHLDLWPQANPVAINPELEAQMKAARQIVEKIHAQRKEAGINVRQPLSTATITHSVSLPDEVKQVIGDEVNVKTIMVATTPSDGQVNLEVKLDTAITPQLKAEGEARELIRKIQDARKAAGTNLNEMVEVVLPAWPAEFESEIKTKVCATKLIPGEPLQIIRHTG